MCLCFGLLGGVSLLGLFPYLLDAKQNGSTLPKFCYNTNYLSKQKNLCGTFQPTAATFSILHNEPQSQQFPPKPTIKSIFPALKTDLREGR